MIKLKKIYILKKNLKNTKIKPDSSSKPITLAMRLSYPIEERPRISRRKIYNHKKKQIAIKKIRTNLV
jgi:hypothetical protein